MSLFGPEQLTLCHRLETLSKSHPTSLALTELDARGEVKAELRYGELYQRVTGQARSLQQRGLRNERVVLALPNGVDFVVSFFACLRAGAVPIAVQPPGRRGGHLNAVVQDASPKMVLSHQQVDLGPSWCSPTGLDGEPREQNLALPGADELAFLQYTSGSTSHPKGVKITHANLVANCELMFEVLQQKPGQTLVSWLPVYHDMGLVCKVLQSVALGGHLVTMQPTTFLWRPFLWLKAVSDYRANLIGAPNFGFELVLQKTRLEQRRQLDLSSLVTAFCAAEPIRQPTAERFIKAFAGNGFNPDAFRHAYGLAEHTVCVSAVHRSSSPPPFLSLSRKALEKGQIQLEESGVVVANCGSTVAPHQLWIADESGHVLGELQLGEVCLEGSSVSPGYWGEPARTNHLRTGDLGFLYQEHLYLVGRSKDVIIVAGRNIYPEDVEATVVSCHSSINAGSCVAFGVDSSLEEYLAIAVETRAGQAKKLPLIIAAAVSESHQVHPIQVFLLKPGELPRTSSGKVRRRACERLLGPSALKSLESPDQPRTLEDGEDAIETFLCTVIRENAPSAAAVEPTRPFDQIGLSSLQRFTITGVLAQRLGLPLAADASWRYQTPRELARHAGGQCDDRLIPLRLGGGQLLIVVQDISGGVSWARHLVAALDPAFTILGAPHTGDQASSMEKEATRHVEAFLERYGPVPVSLICYCVQSYLGLELAHQLRTGGVEIEELAVIQYSPQQGVPGGDEWPGLDRCRRYKPAEYRGSLVVYKAGSETMPCYDLPDAGWGELVSGQIEVVQIPGDHRSVLRPPNVEHLARDLSQRLLH